MGYRHQTLLLNQFAGFTANTVGLVLDTNQSVFEVIDEFALTSGLLRMLFFFEGSGPFFEGNIRIGRVIGSVFVGMHELFLVIAEFCPGIFEFFENDFAKILQFFVAVTGFVGAVHD